MKVFYLYTVHVLDIRCPQESVFNNKVLISFLSPGQSAPVLFDALSEFLDEAIVDDWVNCVVDVIEVAYEFVRYQRGGHQRPERYQKHDEQRRVDLHRLDVHGSLGGAAGDFVLRLRSSG